MQGFSYKQLFQAMQDWPLKSSGLYLANINRMIYLGELRLVRDMDLEIFDVTDQVPVTPGQNTIAKPNASVPFAFTAPIAQGATNATLAAPFTGVTGVYVVTFSDNEIQAVTLSNGFPTATRPLPMANAATVHGVINPFVVGERILWRVYHGTPRR